MSLATLAAKMHVSKGYLSEMERGKKTINFRRIVKAAEVLGVLPRDIVGEADAELLDHLDLMADLSSADREDVLEYARYRKQNPRSTNGG